MYYIFVFMMVGTRICFSTNVSKIPRQNLYMGWEYMLYKRDNTMITINSELESLQNSTNLP